MFQDLYYENGKAVISTKTKRPYTIDEYNEEFGTKKSAIGNIIQDIIGTKAPNLSYQGTQGTAILNNNFPLIGNNAWQYQKEDLNNADVQRSVTDSITVSLQSLIREGVASSVRVSLIPTNGTFVIGVFVTMPDGEIFEYINKLWS